MISSYHFHRDYDSLLHSPNHRNISNLSILLRVHLHPHNPPTDDAKEGKWKQDGTTYHYQRWNPSEFDTFKAAVKRDAEFYLNWPLMGLWLLPDPLERLPDAKEEMKQLTHARPMSSRFRPIVQCGLTVILVDKAKESHVSFDVLRLKDGEPDFRSYDVNRKNKRDRGMLTQRDVDHGKRGGPSGYPQNTVVHELGHVLNLDHINIKHPRCRKGDEDICYGAPGSQKRRNWQGAGNLVTKDNAMPWLRAIYRHSSALVWSATTQMPKEMWFSA